MKNRKFSVEENEGIDTSNFMTDESIKEFQFKRINENRMPDRQHSGFQGINQRSRFGGKNITAMP